MNDVILMAELTPIAVGATAKAAQVQRRAKDAIANVKRARTLLKNAESMLRWCKHNAHKSAQQLADEQAEWASNRRAQQ